MADEAGRVGAVIVAAGAGTRFAPQGEPRKQYRDLRGVPLVLWALRSFLAHRTIREVVLVLPPEDLTPPPAFLTGLPITVVAGGNQRGESVRNGLQTLAASSIDMVLVHDGARPFVTAALIDRVLAAAGSGGVIPVLPVTDTIKEVTPESVVVRTVDRTRYRRVQTPQLFPLESLREVYERADREGYAATDDAALFERYGLPVIVVPGEEENLKVTTVSDFRLAEFLAQALPRPVLPGAVGAADRPPPR